MPNLSIFEEELRRRAQAARYSEGHSADQILAMVLRILETERAAGDLLDVGCGRGDLFRRLPPGISSYTGVDLIRYEGFPESPRAELHLTDLNQALPIGDGVADVVASIETIEHLENPRAFFRELVRVARPGALIIVTTPNVLSALSKLCLVLKNRFAGFQSVDYPAHITALLPSDLMNIGAELKLGQARIVYSDVGRIPGTARQWPAALRGQRFSDNLAYVARRAN